MWIRQQLMAVSVLFVPISGWPAPTPRDEYVFVRDLDRWVGVQRGERVLVGKLDADGNFVKKAYEYPFGSGTSLIPMHSVINLAIPERRPVYELRSFRLIRGVLIRGGTFVPDAGGPELSFEEYSRQYTSPSVPIWNLPGYFKKVDKAKKAKDEKK